ncbi:MAG: DNA polymerase IV [Gammaproteobacteria bacterium]
MNNYTLSKQKHWSRAIALVDMNAFFASVEQRDKPEWRGRPVAVTNGLQGTCIITCSYEARSYGIKTGMRLKEARQKCPELIQCPAAPERYAQTSSAIMSALEHITPDVEIFSVDEAFLDVTHCQRLLGSPATIAQLVKQTVYEASGLLCSLGISINKGIGGYLAERGVYTCGDMARLPVSELARRFGNIGRRIWKMCRGEDPDKVTTHVADPKSIGHGKVMPPDTTDKTIILMYMLHMCEKVATRLRRHELQAKHFYIGLKTSLGWLGIKQRLANPTQDERLIYHLCNGFLEQGWQGEGVHQLQVTALDPHSVTGQLLLFDNNDTDIQLGKTYHQVMDNINHRYGELSLAPARLLNRSSMPNVIAPAWKPYGHRQTIARTTEKN